MNKDFSKEIALDEKHPDWRRVFNEEFVRNLALDIMNLGMTTRQNQLNGCESRSGKEILEEMLLDKLQS